MTSDTSPQPRLEPGVEATARMVHAIVDEIDELSRAVDYGAVNRLVGDIIQAERIYVSGQGRSGLAGQALAQRLMHIGLTTFVVGTIIVPAVSAGDLCIVITGSGKTHTSLHQARQAKQAGARIVAITQPIPSPLAELADWTLTIPTRPESVQHATTLFCQLVQMIFDAVCRLTQQQLGEPDDALYRRHTNFE